MCLSRFEVGTTRFDGALLLLGITTLMMCEFKSSCEVPTLDVEDLKAPIL